ncbi:MAG: BTAD domain-containing putative transcriptional regulator [Gaiellaceae bacterium]
MAPSAAKPRALLALLLLNANRTVSLERIIDELWPEAPPETAAKAVQTYVSQLRKLVGESELSFRGGGYRLTVGEGSLDSARFAQLLVRARGELEAADTKAAHATLVEALALWQGEALEDVRAPFARNEAARLGDLRLEALESRLECDLRLGRQETSVAELEGLAEEHPHRERLVELTMLALYRSGRQAEALALYRERRRRLVGELGLEPGRRLQELERAILRQDPELDAPGRTATASMQAGGKRRRRWPLLAIVAVCGLAAGISLALVEGKGDGSARTATGSAGDGLLRPFVAKLEGLIGQSGEGRREIASLVHRVSLCGMPLGKALLRLETVERNRQSLLEQVAALSVPDSKTAIELSQRFQAAVEASIASDWRYREWIAGLQPRCTKAAAGKTLAQAHAGDARATSAKAAFLALFNPLAMRLGQRTWEPGAL